MKRKHFCIAAIVVFSLTSVISASGGGTQRPRASHRHHRSGTTTGTPVGSGLPDMAVKPQPVANIFQGCQPEGIGGDPDLNKLKNRVDDGNFAAVSFSAVAGLTWPKTIERKHMAQWSASDKAVVAKYEGIPISVEGYLSLVKNGGPGSTPKIQGAREEGKESCNCGFDTHTFHDFHIWLRETPTATQAHSIVVEATPPVRFNHPEWTLDKLTQIATKKNRVRISGWLLLDPDHPDQVGKTRGTIWEIHPIIKIEVQSGSTWVALQ